MVKPISSKRRLFMLSKTQKENTPAQAEDQFPLDLSTEIASASCRRENHRSNNNWDRDVHADNAGVLGTPNRGFMPMSERQQIALVKQMSSPSTPIHSDNHCKSKATTPNSGGRALEKRNERGETPLHLAAIRGDDEKVSQLIKSGAAVSVPDYAGWTALHEACNRGYSEIVGLLLEAGAQVNAKGLDNDTPLHDACVNGHYEIATQLLKSGADTRAVNSCGKSPRDVCHSPAIFALINQFDFNLQADIQHKITGCLEFEGFPKDSAKFSKKYYYYAKAKMSRKTPPTKTEEKTSSPSVTSASNSTASSPTLNTSSSTNNSGPDSPRVTLRLPQVPRTPEKSQHKDSKASEGEDVYEFRCTKDNVEDESKEETQNDPVKSETDSKVDRRSRDENEDDEKKKRKKDEVVAGDKPPKGTNGRSICPGPKNQSSTSGSSSAAATPEAAVATPSESKQTTSTERNAMSPTSSSPKFPENSAEGEDGSAEAVSGAPKVPPLKIVLSTTTVTSSEQEVCSQVGKNGSNRQLPYVVSSSSSEDKDVTSEKKEPEPTEHDEEPPANNASNVVSSSSPSSCAESSVTATSCATSTVGGAASKVCVMPATTTTSVTTPVPTGGSGDKSAAAAARITRSRGGGGSSTDEPVSVKSEPQLDEVMTVTTTDVVPPRKRKLKKVLDVEPPPVVVGCEQTVPNCYEMFFKIRKQVERRRKLLVPVQPKPPQGFKDYLMNRCSYALAGNNNAQMIPPVAFPPTTLSQTLKDLFTEQEDERHKLRLQHQVEKEKLVLSVEQEIIRVHGRAARALANQVLPFSVCTILKDEEVYNVITPEQEEKDRNARSRYNGRLFLSWLQDVDDKWEKIKEAMVLRHHNEAESLHAVQKMDWEWKLKELSLVEESVRPKIEDTNVPIVPVSDFDLLPDMNG